MLGLMTLATVSITSAAPAVTENGTGASKAKFKAENPAPDRAALEGDVTGYIIRKSRAFGPVNEPARSEFLAKAMNLLIANNGVLPTGERTSLTDVRSLNSFALVDLMNSTTVTFYRGMFNPTGDWAGAYGGTIWEFVYIVAPAGQMTAATEPKLVVSSNDKVGTSSNILGHTFQLTNADAYGPGVVGVKADNSRIPSGTSAIEQAPVVIVSFANNSFVVNSQANVTEVVNYDSAVVGGLALTEVLSVNGTVVSTTVLSQGDPRLFASFVVGEFRVSLENVGPDVEYQIQRTGSLVTPVTWSNVVVDGNNLTLRPGQTKKVDASPTSSMAYFRYSRP